MRKRARSHGQNWGREQEALSPSRHTNPKQRRLKTSRCIKTQVIILSKTLTFISKLFWVEQNLGDFVMKGGVGRSQMIIPNTEVFASKPVNGVPRKESVQFLLSYTFNILTTMQVKSVGTFTRHCVSKTGYLPHFTPNNVEFQARLVQISFFVLQNIA